jgi:hypothetical protein
MMMWGGKDSSYNTQNTSADLLLFLLEDQKKYHVSPGENDFIRTHCVHNIEQHFCTKSSVTCFCVVFFLNLFLRRKIQWPKENDQKF